MRSFGLAILALLVSHGIARAETKAGFWGAAAATCVPGDPAIQNDLYLVTAGSVKFKENGAGGLVTLYCPISAPPSLAVGVLNAQQIVYAIPNVLRLTYQDSDGVGTDGQITAQVVVLSKKDGTITFPPAFVDSNMNPNATPESTTQTSAHFKNFFDFRNFYYYVRVDLTRAEKSKATVIFYGVALELED